MTDMTGDHGPIWDAINAGRQLLERHLGQCDMRHAETVRRQEEAKSERHQQTLKLDAINDRMFAVTLSALGGLAMVVVNVAILVGQFYLKKGG